MIILTPLHVTELKTGQQAYGRDTIDKFGNVVHNINDGLVGNILVLQKKDIFVYWNDGLIEHYEIDPNIMDSNDPSFWVYVDVTNEEKITEYAIWHNKHTNKVQIGTVVDGDVKVPCRATNGLLTSVIDREIE